MADEEEEEDDDDDEVVVVEVEEEGGDVRCLLLAEKSHWNSHSIFTSESFTSLFTSGSFRLDATAEMAALLRLGLCQTLVPPRVSTLAGDTKCGKTRCPYSIAKLSIFTLKGILFSIFSISGNETNL